MTDYHIPVMLQKSVDLLVKAEDGVYVDVTFGGGGHAKEILKRLSAKGRLIVFDQDGDSLSNLMEDERVLLAKANFRHLYRFWRWWDLPPVDGVLADLGVSSHQFDTDYRGFSYRYEAELDMRMNEDSVLTAREVLATYNEAELQSIFSKYGEIRNSKKLSVHLCDYRKKGRAIVTTTELNKLLEDVMVGERSKYFSQVYQSLRIEVNGEMESLSEMLDGSRRILKKGGRLVAISYHSLEDRLVKRFVRSGRADGEVPKDSYGRSIAEMKPFGKMILPDEEEQKENSRSRSAKMRVGEKI